MNLILILIILFLLIIYLSKVLIKRSKKATYLKAGKKWEGIVKELRRRK
tara:strand:+ start:1111 stop:1257 length:147 start_codon:yes stop_codon:yes gene_type:complete